MLLRAQPSQVHAERLQALGRLRPGQIVPEIPRNAEPRTGLSMGEHAADDGQGVGDRARRSRTSWRWRATATWRPRTTPASSMTW